MALQATPRVEIQRTALSTSSTKTTQLTANHTPTPNAFPIVPSRELISPSQVAITNLAFRNPTREQRAKLEYMMSGMIPDYQTGGYAINPQIEQRIQAMPFPDDFHLSGRVKNSSKHVLSNLGLRVKILDCPPGVAASTRECETVGETRATKALSIPPDQSRDFDVKLSLADEIVARGVLGFDYSIDYLEGLPTWIFSDDAEIIDPKEQKTSSQ